jgi:hypothetical protein
MEGIGRKERDSYIRKKGVYNKTKSTEGIIILTYLTSFAQYFSYVLVIDIACHIFDIDLFMEATHCIVWTILLAHKVFNFGSSDRSSIFTSISKRIRKCIHRSRTNSDRERTGTRLIDAFTPEWLISKEWTYDSW